MQVFYKTGQHESNIFLDASESHHCINVLRMKQNDEVVVINGKGTFYSTRILKPDPSRVQLLVISAVENYEKRDCHLHIAIAPTKNIDRFEWFLEKAAEIGIDEITPIFCLHSNRVNIRMERLEKVLIAAVKQSLKAYLPKLNQAIAFNDFLNRNTNSNSFIAYCADDYKEHLLTSIKGANDITVLIGPEGDFSPAEVKTAIEKGYIPVSLGKSRLRTETAGVAVAQIVADSFVIRDFR